MLIEVEKNGFWRDRQPPTVSLTRCAEMVRAKGGRVIVEIGSGIQGELSGNSVLVWQKLSGAEKIYAIDLDQKQIDSVIAAIDGDPRIETLLVDGFAFLESFDGIIDLLYLDFWTPDKEGQFVGEGRAEAYRDAFRLAKGKMHPERGMILIDDTDHTHPWKHTHIVPEARRAGYTVIWEGRQTLLMRKP